MLARVARGGRVSRPPNARGFLGKARPPRVSRGLRGGRQAHPKDGRSRFLRRVRAMGEGDGSHPGRSGFWTRRSREREPARGTRPGWSLEKPRPQNAHAPVPQTDTGGLALECRGERGNRGQGTRQNRPATSGEGALLSKGAAENRPRRLFTKNTGLCQAARRSIGSDACPVPEGYADALA